MVETSTILHQPPQLLEHRMAISHVVLLAALMQVQAPESPAQRNTRMEWWRDARFGDRQSTRLNSSHSQISYAVFCLKKQPVGLGRVVQALGRPARHRDLRRHEPGRQGGPG